MLFSRPCAFISAQKVATAWFNDGILFIKTVLTLKCESKPGRYKEKTVLERYCSSIRDTSNEKRAKAQTHHPYWRRRRHGWSRCPARSWWQLALQWASAEMRYPQHSSEPVFRMAWQESHRAVYQLECLSCSKCQPWSDRGNWNKSRCGKYLSIIKDIMSQSSCYLRTFVSTHFRRNRCYHRCHREAVTATDGAAGWHPLSRNFCQWEFKNDKWEQETSKGKRINRSKCGPTHTCRTLSKLRQCSSNLPVYQLWGTHPQWQVSNSTQWQQLHVRVLPRHPLFVKMANVSLMALYRLVNIMNKYTHGVSLALLVPLPLGRRQQRVIQVSSCGVKKDLSVFRSTSCLW